MKTKQNSNWKRFDITLYANWEEFFVNYIAMDNDLEHKLVVWNYISIGIRKTLATDSELTIEVQIDKKDKTLLSGLNFGNSCYDQCECVFNNNRTPPFFFRKMKSDDEKYPLINLPYNEANVSLVLNILEIPIFNGWETHECYYEDIFYKGTVKVKYSGVVHEFKTHTFFDFLTGVYFKLFGQKKLFNYKTILVLPILNSIN
jgi:hypothetical protein